MNLSQVRYFMAVVETGSFTKAAERANVTQPTLSAGIKRLEEDLGTVLIDRGRGAQLTPAGTRFLPRARVILQEWTTARRELRQAKTIRQRLRLGLGMGMPARGLSRLLAGFLAAHPDVALETLEAPAIALHRRLDLGRLDTAILILPEDTDEDSALPLLRQRYVLATPAAHPLSHRATVRIADLDDQPFVIRPQAEVMPAAERLFATHNARPRIVGRTESDAALLMLVEAGIGLALLPHWLPGETVATATLPDLKLQHRIGLAWRGAASEAVKMLAAYAASHAWDTSETRPVIGH